MCVAMTGSGAGGSTARTARDSAEHRYPAVAMRAAPHVMAIRCAITIAAADGPVAFPWWWPTVPEQDVAEQLAR